MMGAIQEAGVIAAQPSSIAGLRAGLFLFALLGALAWHHRRPQLSLLLFLAGTLAGTGFWLIQINGPLGLSTDVERTRQWAQAGVNGRGLEPGSGFVLGIPGERSLVSALSSLGVPLSATHAVPQAAVLVLLLLMIATPQFLLARPSTRAFAGILALAGGLWPGFEIYGSALRAPARTLVMATLLAFAVVVRARPGARRLVKRFRSPIVMSLLALGAFAVALPSEWPDPWSPLITVCAGLLVASPARAATRQLSSPRTASSWEAAALFFIFCGSGIFWWDPVATVDGFAEARSRSDAIRRPMEWIDVNVQKRDIVLASPEYSATIAAIGRHRVLFPPPTRDGTALALPEPFRRARLMESARKGRPIAALATSFDATHFLLGPGEPAPPTETAADSSDETAFGLQLVYHDVKDFRIFRFTKK